MRTLSTITFAGVTLALLHPGPASAQFGDGLSQTALAVQAYDKTSERCFYEPVVRRALNRLREHYAEAEPYRWRRTVRESVDTNDMVRNLMGLALQGSPYTADPRVSGPPKPLAAPADQDCAASGLSVGSALAFAGPLIGFDPTLFGEADRLMKGGGKARTGPPGTGSRSDASPGMPPATENPMTAGAGSQAPRLGSGPSPEAVVREFVDYGVTGREEQLTGDYRAGATAALQGLFSKGFVRDWERAWATGENIFDGSIVSGLPSVESTRLKGVWQEADTGGIAMVTAALVMRADGEVISHDQAFVLVHEDGRWKIDEIVYGRKEDAIALHSILKSAVPVHGAPEAKR